MIEKTHVSDLLAAYALRCLDADEDLHVSVHLAECVQCREELEAFQAVTDCLASAVPDAQAPSDLKAKILQKIQPSPVGRKDTSSAESWLRQIMSSFRPFVPAWNIASAVAIVLLTFSSVIFWQRSSDLEHRYLTQDFQHVVLKCTHVVPEAGGQVLVSNDGAVGMLAVSHLPELNTGQVYQVWLLRDGQRSSGGSFTVNQQGYGMLRIDAAESLLDCEISITVEPREGSAEPSGDTVLQTMI